MYFLKLWGHIAKGPSPKGLYLDMCVYFSICTQLSGLSGPSGLYLDMCIYVSICTQLSGLSGPLGMFQYVLNSVFSTLWFS